MKEYHNSQRVLRRYKITTWSLSILVVVSFSIGVVYDLPKLLIVAGINTLVFALSYKRWQSYKDSSEGWHKTNRWTEEQARSNRRVK